MSGLANRFEMIFGRNPRVLSLLHLQWIAECFADIPYENLTKIIRASEHEEFTARKRSPLDVLDGYCRWGAGGTCFSLTNCLRELLNAYGYISGIHMADMGSNHNNHCALVAVFQEGQYLIDPGYLITTPMHLPASGSVILDTRLHPVRLERAGQGQDLFMSTLEPECEKFRYRLRGTPCSEEEFLKYWEESFEWTMMNSLLVTRHVPHGRIYHHDRYFRFSNREGKRTEKIKDGIDQQIALRTGLNTHLIYQARSILLSRKPALKERGDSNHG